MTAVRLVQLARILGLDPSIIDDDVARAAIAARPAELGAALFEEAAQNDDVTSTETALDYLEGRLAFFSGLVSAEAEAAVRAEFGERLKAWE